ncbi:MAG: pilus assembly protein [Lysobacteraceae bacterium]|jgi:type IV pilus assembly protein PilY1
MATFSLSRLLAALVATVVVAVPIQAQAQVALSQEPLYITNRIKPAFIMAIDDSGSMQWETLFPAQDGRGTWNGAQNRFYHPTELAPNGLPRPYRSTETGNGNGLTSYLELFPFPGRGTPANTIPPLPNFGFARSHIFNPGYFNPFLTYAPWAYADRSSWPNASITAARVDPRVPASPAFNLTADVQQDGDVNVSSNTWLFDVRVGMLIPAGTVYSRNTGTCDFGGTQIGTTGWWTVNADFTLAPPKTNCRVGIRYYPATFYLTTPTFPGYTATPLLIANPAGGPPNTTLYRFEIRPENMTAAAYSATMQNFANWFSYYRNRNLAMIAAVTRAFVDIDFMRVGAFTINNRVNVTMYDMGIQADRNAFYTLVTAFNGNSGTPNRFAIDHLGNQFRRTGAGAPVQLACQMNAGMLFTDGYSNGGGPTVGSLDAGLGAPFADAIANKKGDIVARHYTQNIRTDLTAGLVRVPPACSGPNPDPRLDCRTDPHMNFYGVTLGAIGTVFGVNALATSDPYANPPVWPGRCDDCLEAVDELWQATLTGRGRYINAASPQDISQAMNDVVNAVLDSTQPVGTPAVAGARIDSSSASFQTSFSARNNARDWIGNVTAFRINSNGSIGAQLWDAEAKLAGRATSRNMIATRVAGGSGTRQVVNFQASSFGASEADRAAVIGVSLPSFTANFTAGLTMTDAYDYLRGVRSQEFTGSRPLGFRSRSGVIGSIINSPAVFESNTSFLPYYASLPNAEGDAYRAYMASKRAAFRPTVFVGANAGFLHAFDAQNGDELFAFAPNGALGQMGLLLNRNYQHRYFVDGKFNVVDAKIGGLWRTVLVGNMGRGGRSVFALNVTNPNAFTGADVLWDLPTNDNDLGFSLGRPEVFEGEDGVWYAAFGNGINSTNGNPVLYIVNLSTGAIVRRITANDGGEFTNGLLQTGIWDADGNGRIDTVYGGDFRGNLWKFDLSAASSATWTVALGGSPLFRATDTSSVEQPITGAISVSNGVSGGTMVHFGTGRYLSDTDAASGGPFQIQTFYGVWDRGSTSGITRASLQQQQILSQFGSGASSGRVISENVVDYATRNGWFIDLRVGASPSIGERVIGDPIVRESDIVFTANEPSADTQCAPGLRTWVYRLGRFTGRPVLDRRPLPNGDPACPTADCGALVASNSGAPVMGAGFVTPQRACRPGIDPQCPPLDPMGPNPVPPPPVGLACGEQGSAGAAAIGATFRPCGRQSWRQVR